MGPPAECADLYHVLESYTEAYTADWTSKNMPAKVTLKKKKYEMCITRVGTF